MIKWQWYRFEDFTPDDFFNIAEQRQAVFIVEQQCAYQDLDSSDQLAWHIVCWDIQPRSKQLVSYCRVIPPQDDQNDFRIGRVLTHKAYRNLGYARELMGKAISIIEETKPEKPIVLSAQVYLTDFYESFGFVVSGKPYLEDGIEHISMKRINKRLK